MRRCLFVDERRTGSTCGSALPHNRNLVINVGKGVDVGDVESGALYGDELVVYLRAIGGIEDVDLAAISGIDLVELLDPAEAGEIAVVVLVLIGVGEGDVRVGIARIDFGSKRT